MSPPMALLTNEVRALVIPLTFLEVPPLNTAAQGTNFQHTSHGDIFKKCNMENQIQMSAVYKKPILA